MKRIICLILFCVFSVAFAIESGALAPDFSLPNQDGKVIHLHDFSGKPVVLYFYPKDDTPGCTLEAKNFRDSSENLKQYGAVVLGVSMQSAKSHQEFRDKYKLPFDLLVDTDGKLNDLFGIGKIPVAGIYKRKTVLIGPDQKVVRFYDNVDPKTHTSQVLADLKALNQSRN